MSDPEHRLTVLETDRGDESNSEPDSLRAIATPLL